MQLQVKSQKLVVVAIVGAAVAALVGYMAVSHVPILQTTSAATKSTEAGCPPWQTGCDHTKPYDVHPKSYYEEGKYLYNP